MYASRSNAALSASTDSFMKSIHRKSNQNPTSSLARCLCVSFLRNIKAIPHIPISGKANAEILNDPNPNHAITTDDSVVPMFAQIITQIALYNCITPAPTNAIVINDTSELLCNSAVDRVPVKIELNALLVYFWMIVLSFLHPRKRIAFSNICIANNSIPIPATSSRILNIF